MVDTRRRAILAHSVAGLAAAFTMTALLFELADIEFSLARVASVTLVHVFPLVLIIVAIGATTRQSAIKIILVYTGIYAITAALVIQASPNLHIVDLGVLWVTKNLLPTLLVWVVLLRPIRAIGPMVIIFFITSLIGANLAISWLDLNLERVIAVALPMGFGALGTFITVAGIGFLLFALIGWLVLSILRRLYQNRRLSDQSLTLDAIWALFIVTYATALTFEGGVSGFFIGLIPFIVYRVCLFVALRLLLLRDPSQPVPRLLFLRVFSLGDKTIELWQGLNKSWRYIGHMRMIAGPDLAKETIEPHEFLDFISGKLADHFIDDPAGLKRALGQLHESPDRDGLFRVGEFFCRDEAWRATFERLAGESDAVLMDLRNFSASNHGCRFELDHLVRRVPAHKVVLIVDESTDQHLLNQALADSAVNAGHQRESGPWEPTLLDFSKATADANVLHTTLCAAAAKSPRQQSGL